MGKYTIVLKVMMLTISVGTVLSTLYVSPHLILTTNHMKDFIVYSLQMKK